MALWIWVVLLFIVCENYQTNAASSNSNLNDHKNNNFQIEKTYTLRSIEDVEMLTYFLLWKYDYFNTTPDLNHNQDYEDDLDHLNESKLREFIEKLKINHLITNTPSLIDLKKTCTNKTFRYLSTKSWWPQNSYDKTKLICEAASSCKNAKNLIQLVGFSSFRTPTLSQSIARLCPLMLFQLQEKECVEQQESNFKAKNKPSMGSVWGFGILFVTIVSFCSIAGVGILPFLSDHSYNIMITILEGLAVGSLLGSALFHLIPQAFNLIMPGNYEYLWRALIIFGGIYLFFWSERIMKIVSEFRRNKKSKDFSIPSSTSLENDPQKFRQIHYKNSDEMKIVERDGKSTNDLIQGPQVVHMNGIKNEDNEFLKRERTNSNLALKHDHAHVHGESDEIATIAWMIIFGDGLHNFIDGVTMGAAFSQSILEGISISVAVICEEFPHELGDFAILLGSGMSMRKALGYNFLSACTCYLGLVFGILLGDLSDATPYVFALAGGMFLYISLVDMMGELSSKLENAGKRGLTYTAQILVLQNIGILIGVSIMFFLAKYSDKINFEGLVPPKNYDIPFTES